MTRDNLKLMCRAHNALLAERDYGRDYMKSRVAKRQDQTGSHRTIASGPDRMNRERTRNASHIYKELRQAAASRSSEHERDQAHQHATEQPNPVRAR